MNTNTVFLEFKISDSAHRNIIITTSSFLGFKIKPCIGFGPHNYDNKPLVAIAALIAIAPQVCLAQYRAFQFTSLLNQSHPIPGLLLCLHTDFLSQV